MHFSMYQEQASSNLKKLAAFVIQFSFDFFLFFDLLLILAALMIICQAHEFLLMPKSIGRTGDL